MANFDRQQVSDFLDILNNQKLVDDELLDLTNQLQFDDMHYNDDDEEDDNDDGEALEMTGER